MSKLILLTALATGTLAAQDSYNVLSCTPGYLCSNSQVTVTRQIGTDPRIILGGTNINDVMSRNLQQFQQQELIRQQIEINRRIIQQMRAQQRQAKGN